MVLLAPFKPLRYNPEQISFISRVIAPPYDIIDPPEAEELRARDPYNAIHLILGKEGDSPRPPEEYAAAASKLAQWRQNGILLEEAVPAVYVCQQTFTLDGERCSRRGFYCVLLPEETPTGGLMPHEHTMAGPKSDRRRLMEACNANLSQIFAVFSDPEGEIDALVSRMCNGSPLYEFGTPDGVTYRLWRVLGPALVARLSRLLQDQSMFIADGHHRYEAALMHRDSARDADRPPGESPEDYIPAFCVSVRNSGLRILPTHRLVKAAESFDSARFLEELRSCFEVKTVSVSGPNDLASAVQRLLEGDATPTSGPLAMLPSLRPGGPPPPLIGCYLSGQQLHVLQPASMDHLEAQLPDRAPEWKRLPVAILHHCIIQPIFGIPAEERVANPRLRYSQDPEDVYWKVETGAFDAGFFLPAIDPATVQQVARAGEKMPPKSTFFYPKVSSGPLFYPFEESSCPHPIR